MCRGNWGLPEAAEYLPVLIPKIAYLFRSLQRNTPGLLNGATGFAFLGALRETPGVRTPSFANIRLCEEDEGRVVDHR